MMMGDDDDDEQEKDEEDDEDEEDEEDEQDDQDEEKKLSSNIETSQKLSHDEQMYDGYDHDEIMSRVTEAL